MIIELFIIFVLMAFVLIWLGYHIDIRAISVIGFVFLFVLSFTINPHVSSIYGDRGLEYVSGSNVTTYGSNTLIVDTYSTYDTNTTVLFSWLLAIISGVCFWLVLVNKGGATQ